MGGDHGAEQSFAETQQNVASLLSSLEIEEKPTSK